MKHSNSAQIVSLSSGASSVDLAGPAKPARRYRRTAVRPPPASAMTSMRAQATMSIRVGSSGYISTAPARSSSSASMAVAPASSTRGRVWGSRTSFVPDETNTGPRPVVSRRMFRRCEAKCLLDRVFKARDNARHSRYLFHKLNRFAGCIILFNKPRHESAPSFVSCPVEYGHSGAGWRL